jgi:hypothetical protein
LGLTWLAWLGGLGLAALVCGATVAATPPAEIPILRLPTTHWLVSNAEKGGASDLLLAVARRDVAATARTLREGGNPNDVGPMLQGGLRTSPLGMAAALGDAATVELLLGAGALPDGPVGTRPPIWNAALTCNVDVTRTLVRRGASVGIRRGARGVTPLLAACQGACPSVACLMIEGGADPHAATVDGVTPLMAAAWWGSVAVLRELLDSDPDLLATDHAGHDGVYFAALRGHTDCLRLLLDAGSKSDRATVHGWTALMAAARSGCTSCITLLLDHKADPNATAANGWSPMQEAARHCHADVMKQLLAVGTSVGITKARWTALDEAVRGGCPDAMRVLLESDAGLHAGRHHVDTAADQINARIQAAIASPAVQARLAKCQQVLDEAKKRAEETF